MPKSTKKAPELKKHPEMIALLDNVIREMETYQKAWCPRQLMAHHTDTKHVLMTLRSMRADHLNGWKE